MNSYEMMKNLLWISDQLLKKSFKMHYHNCDFFAQDQSISTVITYM